MATRRQAGRRGAARLVAALVAAAALVASTGVAGAGGGNQPDVIVHRPHGVDYTGVDVYNTTGSGQALANVGPRGSTSVYKLRVVNDGPETTAIRLRGCASNAQFRVRYYRITPSVTVPDVEVTAAVSGTGLVFSRDPQDAYQFTITIQSKPAAARGDDIECRLKATTGNGANRLVDVGIVQVVVGNGGK